MGFEGFDILLLVFRLTIIQIQQNTRDVREVLLDAFASD